jgi:hypothetical protein
MSLEPANMNDLTQFPNIVRVKVSSLKREVIRFVNCRRFSKTCEKSAPIAVVY